MIVGIVPAAGHATRLQPLPCSKEVLPVGGRPVMDYLVERMRTAGADEIRVVTRPEKRDVVGHAQRTGATVISARPRNVSESLAAGAAGLADDVVVLFGFPDTLWGPADGFRPLVHAVEAGAAVALGAFRGREPERSDVVEFGEDGTVRRIEVKPRVPRSTWIWGCAALSAETLRPVAAHGEPGDYFDRLAGAGGVVAVPLSGEFVDVGTPEALARIRLGEEPVLEQRVGGGTDGRERKT